MYTRVPVSEKKENSKISKTAAYSSFSGLYSLFSDKDLCCRFELYSSAKSSDKDPASNESTSDKIESTKCDPLTNETTTNHLVPLEATSDPGPAVLSEAHKNSGVLNASLEESTFTESMASNVPRFITPFKTRGNCGCIGCLTNPCGECYFCKNKEAK